MDMGVTGNCQLLLGMVAGLLRSREDLGYEIVSVAAAAGQQVVRNTTTGNTFRISSVQIGGVE